MTRKFIAVAGSCVLAAADLLLPYMWTGWPGGREALLRPDDRALVARGKAIYLANCASCHGDRLEGQPNWTSPGPDNLMPAPPHDETGHTWHHADGLLFAITKSGMAQGAGIEGYKSAMPIYDGVLSDDEIIAVLSYIKAQWSREIRERHDALNRQQSDSAN